METLETHETMTTAQKNTRPDAAKVLHLEAGLEGERVRISLAVQCAGEMQTVRQVEELGVAMARIERRCQAMVQFLNQVNRQGRLTPDVLSRVQETGQLLRDELFSADLKERLNSDDGDILVLTLDDTLVHLPWELLHDGSEFLGQRFAMGRVVRTRRPVVGACPRELAPPLRILVLADPCGDLNAAYEEGLQIRGLAECRPDLLEVTFRSTGVQSDFLRAKLRSYDWVHFAGHADFYDADSGQNGWRLGNDRLTAEDVQRMAGTGCMPALVFANACQSARCGPRPDTQARMFTMANAFLLSGVKHYLGTFWEIPDAQSRHFALAFYNHLLNGGSMGAAVLAARRDIMARYGREDIVWASYLLYGDPTTTYFRSLSGQPVPQATAQDIPVHVSAELAAGVRAPEDSFHLGKAARHPATARRWWGVAAMLVAIAIAWLWWSGRKDPGFHAYEQQAIAAFQAGRYEQVFQVCDDLQRKQPQRSLGFLLMGNVHFYNGELERAHNLYQRAIQAEDGPDMEKAEAFLGLGRIASERGSTDQALDYYWQAAQLAPDSEQPLVAQALLQDRAGNADTAMALLEQAKPVATDTRSIEALALQIQANAALKADAQRRARIDRLIDELVQQMETTEGPTAPSAVKPQTGNVLSIWFDDLESVGYTLREGTATLIASGLMERLLATKQIQLVERDLLDGLMNEIKLGASPLTDAGARLQLGRLTAARIIVTGRVVHSPPDTQVSLRCIETDTGEVFAVVNANFEGKTTVAAMVDRLSDKLLANIKAKYPLQAAFKGSHLN
jgi:CHAT domain-containing protein/tetratricopeptide (TPR) repeat protein